MPLAFELRPAKAQDLDFCWPIYRDAMQSLAGKLMEWREPVQRRVVEKALAAGGSSILRAEGADAGWVDVAETRHVVQLRQLYLAPAMRNRGLGTAFLNWMKERADRKRKDLTLEVLANNPARHLYERLGFKAVSTTDNRVTMRY